MSERLELKRFPLRGVRLIEASAGTGKTFTISALVLRLLLGVDEPAREPLAIEQILVVTFTEAATAELRARIRLKIHQARIDFLRGQSSDSLTHFLLSQSCDPKVDAERLLVAEQNMDQASVFTIHGFCQRMLKEHAFESGMAFESEFLTSEYSLKLRAVEDCWRQQFYPLPEAMVARVMRFWHEPKALLDQLQGVLAQPQLQLEGALDVDPVTWFTQRIAQIDVFKQQWQTQSDTLAQALSQSDLDKRSYTKSNVPKWLHEIELFARNDTVDETLPKNLGRFGSDMLSAKTKSGAIASHPLITAIDALLESGGDLKAILMGPLIRQIRGRFSELKAQQQQLGFDDLLSMLADALNDQRDGVLATSIRSHYPVAMIDEFQDTDPQQYRIFNTVYGHTDDEDHALFLIGDPKQAIYGFRGADIFTYMQARQQVSAHYTLPVNYRSSGPMVDAVNGLFSWYENPFIYRDAIQFSPVESAPSLRDRAGLVVEGQSQNALNFVLAESSTNALTSRDYRSMQAKDCAARIRAWLCDGQLDEGSRGSRAVVPADIAVLVRTNREGQLIAQALRQLAIPYVLRASRDSVFASDEGYQWYLQLAAALHPTNERLLHAALASPLLGYSLAELETIGHDEMRWQACVETYQRYQRIWRKRGVLPLLYHWLEQKDMAGHLLRERAGERQLTNLLHLGELLQQQSQQLDGEAALLRWFARQLLEPDVDADEQQLRLESDARLIQIVTIHKSKGLEYPLVLVPFAFSFRESSEALYHRDGHLTLALDDCDEAKEQSKEERLGEDLRLLYVALTRAKYHCSLGVAPLARTSSAKKTTVHQSALGFLLQHAQAGSKQQLTDALEALTAQYPVIGWERAIAERPEPLPSLPAPSEILNCRFMQRGVVHNWWLTSYSSLSRQSQHYDASDEMSWLDQVVIEEQGTNETVLDPFHFARGAKAGTFLHSVFELIDFQASEQEVRIQMTELLARAGYDEQWLDVVIQLRAQVLQAPLRDGGTREAFYLARVAGDQRLAEMEFAMPLAGLSAKTLNPFLQANDPLSAKARPLRFEQIEGMLKGFIDLICCVDGRYYVLDYKSNHLGDSYDDYNRSAMEQAMIEHRYDFQYQLYSVALLRLLRLRLPDFEYERHFGGVYYLFIRGMAGPSDRDTGVYFARPDEVFLHQLDMLIGDADG